MCNLRFHNLPSPPADLRECNRQSFSVISFQSPASSASREDLLVPSERFLIGKRTTVTGALSFQTSGQPDQMMDSDLRELERLAAPRGTSCRRALLIIFPQVPARKPASANERAPAQHIFSNSESLKRKAIDSAYNDLKLELNASASPVCVQRSDFTDTSFRVSGDGMSEFSRSANGRSRDAPCALRSA